MGISMGMKIWEYLLLIGGGQPTHLEKSWSESQRLADDIPYMKWKNPAMFHGAPTSSHH